MSLPFDVTGKMIAQLTDTQLRELLCEIGRAELRRVGISAPDVLIAGGDQDAADGGVDVRLMMPETEVTLPFLRRPAAIFQSKASKMPGAKITAEMRPDGRLRPSIAGVLKAGGAYVIASSKEELTDLKLKDRVNAMRKALGTTRLPRAAVVDFYDQGRLAQYSNEYPSAALWVRDALGSPAFGWEPIGNWSRTPTPMNYVTDSMARVWCNDVNGGQPMSVEQTLEALRGILLPGKIARLTGQSGTGKTRLAEALFQVPDANVGDVIYADCGAGSGPTPTPNEMLHRLLSDGRRFSVVLDNCPLPVHETCSKLARNSNVSLLTIEADVDDEVGSETTSFHLAPASDGVIVEVLEHAAPKLPRINLERIAHFAGGNSRIALALAKQIRQREDISGLPDALLFRRLFLHESKGDDPELMRAAEACALVYSFDGQGSDSDELVALARLADVEPGSLYRHVAELTRRELMQKRDEWRALLPQALAHRLAATALENRPPTEVRRVITEAGGPRMLRSFARRLGFLAQSSEARKLAIEWVTELMGNPGAVDAETAQFVGRLAPLAPVQVIEGLERLAKSDQVFKWGNGSRWASLLRHLAYQPELFDRAIGVLSVFALTERQTHGANSTCKSALRALFKIRLSGTHATPQQRVAAARRLLDSDDAARRNLGVELIDAMLDAGPFTSGFDPSFGAEPRSYGWWVGPEPVRLWFEQPLALVCELTMQRHSCAAALCGRLTARFRGLVRAGMVDALADVADAVLADGQSWFDGWIAARETLKYEKASLSTRARRRLEHLERQLAPQSIDDRLAAYFHSRNHFRIFDDQRARTRALRQLAREALADKPRFRERVSQCYHRRDFGAALAHEASNPRALWRELLAGFKALPDTEQSAELLTGALDVLAMKEPRLATTALNAALLDAALLPHFVRLQSARTLSVIDARRLIRAVRDANVPVETFRDIGYGRVNENVPANVFAQLVQQIADRPGGLDVALEIMELRLSQEKESVISAETAQVGRALLASIKLHETVGHLDDRLAAIAQTTLEDPVGAPLAKQLLCAIAKAAKEGWAHQLASFARILCHLHPEGGLDAFAGATGAQDDEETNLSWNLRNMEPFRTLDDEQILAWVGKDASRRAPQIARLLPLLDQTEGGGRVQFSSLGQRLLTHVIHDPEGFLSALNHQFRVNESTGSRVSALRPFHQFAGELTRNPVAEIAAWADEVQRSLAAEMEEWEGIERNAARRFEQD